MIPGVAQHPPFCPSGDVRSAPSKRSWASPLRPPNRRFRPAHLPFQPTSSTSSFKPLAPPDSGIFRVVQRAGAYRRRAHRAMQPMTNTTRITRPSAQLDVFRKPTAALAPTAAIRAGPAPPSLGALPASPPLPQKILASHLPPLRKEKRLHRGDQDTGIRGSQHPR